MDEETRKEVNSLLRLVRWVIGIWFFLGILFSIVGLFLFLKFGG